MATATSTPAVKTSIEVVTPERAAELLAVNRRNRTLSQKHVDYLVRQMLAGTFRTNGDTIRIDRDGVFLDGQHRLTAIVKSGIPQEMILVTGLDPAVRHTIDSNHRSRSPSDVLRMEGYSYSVQLAGAAKMVWGYIADGPSGALYPGLSNEDVLEMVEAYPALQASARYAATHMSGRSGSRKIAAFVHFVGGCVDADERDAFFDRALRGLGLEEGDPELALREKMERHISGVRPLKPEQQLIYWVQAWNHRMAGTRISSLQTTRDGRVPDFAPQPTL